MPERASGGVRGETSEARYAEGKREPTECGECHQPIWIVYHGPRRNHTVEPRLREAAEKVMSTQLFAFHGATEEGLEALKELEEALGEVDHG